MSKRYDIIVLGLGSTGSSITYFLARKNASNVLAIDARCSGCGQTSRSSALIRLHYTNPVIRSMAIYSWRFWREFQDHTGCEYSVFTRTGIAFVGPEDYVDTMNEIVHDIRSKGIEAYLYDPTEFKKEVYKNFNEDGIAGVAWEPESGYGDPNTSVRCFIEYARKNGVDVLEYTSVKKLLREDSKLIGIETEDGVIKGEIFINALGVWCNDLLATIDKQLPIKYAREDVIYLENPGDIDGIPPGWGDLVYGFYSRPDGATKTLVGTLEAEYVDNYDEPGEYTTPPMDVVNKRMEIFTRRFPDMIKARPSSVIYGYYDVTPDWQPIIGYDNEIENLIHMVGLSGHGFKLAPAYGEVISDIALYGRSKMFNVDEFKIDRFYVGVSKHSKYKYGIIG